MVSKALIWDMDGVIADTAPFHFLSWQRAAQERGITFTESDFKQIFGKRNPEIIAEKFGADIPAPDVDALAQRKEEHFRTLVGQNVKPFPGVLSLLHSLKAAKWKMAVVSSTPMENIELITRSLEIAGLFDTVVSDRDVSRGKPDPEGFLLAAERLGVEPGYCVVIEDAIAGVRAAKNAGMKCVAVTNTHPAERLAEADMAVDSLENITAGILESLLL
ncbi:MAG: HAD family phosphatase [Dehalococcoidia bacterium]